MLILNADMWHSRTLFIDRAPEKLAEQFAFSRLTDQKVRYLVPVCAP